MFEERGCRIFPCGNKCVFPVLCANVCMSVLLSSDVCLFDHIVEKNRKTMFEIISFFAFYLCCFHQDACVFQRYSCSRKNGESQGLWDTQESQEQMFRSDIAALQ